MPRQRKRKAAQAKPNVSGMARALAVARDADPPSLGGNSSSDESAAAGPAVAEGSISGKRSREEGWETVGNERSSKRRKVPTKAHSRYPAIVVSRQSRQQLSIKISDLQALVLYILGDGIAPNWVSVRHYSEIRKVVVLMIPGLEKGWFTGDIKLEKEDEASPSPQHHLSTSNPFDKLPDRGSGSAETEGARKDQGPAANEEVSLDRSIVANTTAYQPIPLVVEQLPASLKPFASIFPLLWPVLTPGDDKYGKMHSPVDAMLKSLRPRSKEAGSASVGTYHQSGQGQRTRITEFLTSVEDMQEYDYPVHPAHLNSEDERHLENQRRRVLRQSMGGDFIDSNVGNLIDGNVPEDQIEEGSVTAGRDVLALDCEMCRTTDKQLALTRISIVNWAGAVLMDELVKPDLPIEDYLTVYSGITKAMLEPVQTSLSDIQSRLLRLLHPKTILVGHSLNADLAAIRLSHPFIVDTSIIFPHPRGPPLKSSLKLLSKKFLGREIQMHHGSTGHDSIEDAKACLDLVKEKCEHGPGWNASGASVESVFTRLSRTPRPAKHSDGTSANAGGRLSATIDWSGAKKGVGAPAAVHIGCQDDVEVVRGIETALLGSGDGGLVPGGGVDFVWARLRAVELCQEWWSPEQTTTPDGSRRPSTPEHKARSKTEQAKERQEAVKKMADHVSAIYQTLPPCTAFIVYSGSGDPREMCKLQLLRQQFRQEYQVKKWDELSVQWTDTEQQQLQASTRKAREGFALITVK